MSTTMYQCMDCKNVWIEYPNTRITGICLECNSKQVKTVFTLRES